MTRWLRRWVTLPSSICFARLVPHGGAGLNRKVERVVAELKGVESTLVTASKAEGERVVLGRRNKFTTMVPFHWSDEAPPGLNDVEWAEELGAKWEGDELVTYDYPSFIGLLEYYEKGEYLPDND
ncbi:MAG: hypothetical protein ACRDST_08045 [Pseudonocardiaceae bacterium]